MKDAPIPEDRRGAPDAVPAPTDPAPAPTDPAPASADTVPAPAEAVPPPAEAARAPAEAVPALAEAVPDPSEATPPPPGAPPPSSRPPWVNAELWPWEPRWVEAEAGRLHVVDEGPRDAPAFVFVHGTPTWSFLWRHLLADLSRDHRVVAFDHLGFGLSDRPEGWGYRPEDHARNVGRVVEALGLERFTLIVHDFGGPIGLGWVLDGGDADRLDGLVLFNTWCWSLEGTRAGAMSRILGSRVGRLLYRRNFSPRTLLPMGFADRKRLDPEVHRHYLDAFPGPDHRHAPWVLARELGASGAWYDGLWARRNRLLSLPILFVWGMKDPAFGPDALERWRGAFPSAAVDTVDDAGHFVQEEAPDRAAAAIRRWKAGADAGAGSGAG